MDNLIFNLENLSQAVLERLEEMSYEELVTFVDSRQPILDEMSAVIATQSLSPNQKLRIQNLVQNDALIEARMKEFQREASSWLRQRDAAKVQRNAYDSAYPVDSMLMDQRK